MKFYTDTSRIPEKYVIPPAKRNNPYLILTEDLGESSYVLLPVRWEIPYDYTDREYTAAGLDPADRNLLQQETQRLLALAESAGKQAVIIYVRDNENDLPVSNAVVFRTSLAGSRRTNRAFAMPVWTEDISVMTDGNINSRGKQSLPSVGFMGKAGPLKPGARDTVKKILNKITSRYRVPLSLPLSWDAHEELRSRAIRLLSACDGIRTDIHISRRFYYGRRQSRLFRRDRSAFINNIIQNDYTLCMRGGGNYSYRLYETMSAGRIPLFINTDCVLPYDFLINWKDHLVWVEESDLYRIGSILLDFHRSLTEEEFLVRQREIRRLWEEWLSPEGFFKNFHRHFTS